MNPLELVYSYNTPYVGCLLTDVKRKETGTVTRVERPLLRPWALEIETDYMGCRVSYPYFDHAQHKLPKNPFLGVVKTNCFKCKCQRSLSDFGYDHLRVPGLFRVIFNHERRTLRKPCRYCYREKWLGRGIGESAEVLAFAVLDGDNTALPPLVDELIEKGLDVRAEEIRKKFRMRV